MDKLTEKLSKRQKCSEVKNSKYKRYVNTNMKDHGEIDDKTRTIKVNPKKGDFLNTVIHEELHKQHWDKDEKWIRKKSRDIEKSIPVSKMIDYLKKYK